jgi:hypothetical protein
LEHGDHRTQQTLNLGEWRLSINHSYKRKKVKIGTRRPETESDIPVLARTCLIAVRRSPVGPLELSSVAVAITRLEISKARRLDMITMTKQHYPGRKLSRGPQLDRPSSAESLSLSERKNCRWRVGQSWLRVKR